MLHVRDGKPRTSWGSGLPEATQQKQVLREDLLTPNAVHLGVRGEGGVRETKQVELGIAQVSTPVEVT